MRRIFSVFISVGIAISLYAESQAVSPVTIPSLNNEQLKVCVQNLRNYFYNYSSTTRKVDYSDSLGFADKTRKIVDMVGFTNADIYAFCELEANDIILKQLVDSLNKIEVGQPFAYITDDISDTEYTYIKSGFVYRKDKVRPIGGNRAATSRNYYHNTQRIVTFEELATKERFSLSMNHFRAQDDSTEDDEAMRINNSNDLLAGLKFNALDEDILIVGDLNSQIDEEDLQILINAGYEEQLIKYNAAAYSYCWNKGKTLIDHVFANSSMSEQITKAEVYHLCTSCTGSANKNYRYSDHDVLLIGLNLYTPKTDFVCTNIDYSESFATDIGNFKSDDQLGSAYWYNLSSYDCFSVNGYKKGAQDDWLISPTFDLREKTSAVFSFAHAESYGNISDYSRQLQLLVSDDYEGDVTEANWEALKLSYKTNFGWTNETFTLDSKYIGKENITIAFRYVISATDGAPQWEIKNFKISSACSQSTGLYDESEDNNNAIKVIEDGKLYIQIGNEKYNILGMKITR